MTDDKLREAAEAAADLIDLWSSDHESLRAEIASAIVRVAEEHAAKATKLRQFVDEVDQRLNTAWSLTAEWLADMADTLEHVRREDGAPLRLTPEILADLLAELREDRDHWKKRAEAAEFALGASRDECAALRQNEAILAEQACPEGDEKTNTHHDHNYGGMKLAEEELKGICDRLGRDMYDGRALSEIDEIIFDRDELKKKLSMCICDRTYNDL